nr:hypothetical protein [Melissococcus plutonius]
MDALSDKKVSGTVMLNLNDGSKRFLIHKMDQKTSFATTNVADNMTGLASILQLFKEKIQLDISSINLVELTNAHTEEENIPLFVFEIDENQSINQLKNNYYWENPSKLINLLTSYDIKGVPLF